VDDKIIKPKNNLLAAIGGSKANLTDLSNLCEMYNEKQIQAEIEKLKKSGTRGLEEQGKKLFKVLCS
jgi:hypothetical protein